MDTMGSYKRFFKETGDDTDLTHAGWRLIPGIHNLYAITMDTDYGKNTFIGYLYTPWFTVDVHDPTGSWTGDFFLRGYSMGDIMGALKKYRQSLHKNRKNKV
jgi:hypothetical protein